MRKVLDGRMMTIAMKGRVDRREFKGGIVGVIPEAIDIEGIKAANEAVKACCVTGEAKCPNRDHDSALVCCIHDDPAKLTGHIDALLAEVERLNSKRWAYFSAPQYYPSGGMADCVSRHATEAEATAAMGKDLDGEVVDLFAEE